MRHSTDPVEQARDRIYLELTNRSMLLTIHAIVAILLGTAMATTGAPGVIEADWGPWSRLFLGLTAIALGCTLLVGVALSYRRLLGYWTLIVGTTGLAIWQSMLMYAYAAAAFDSPLHLLRPGQELDPSVINRGYIPFVYLGYVLLISTHAGTLMLLDRPRR